MFLSWQTTDFNASPQPGCPLRPFHTLGVSGFKASSRVFKSYFCFPSIPPGNLARSEWVMFQETLREVNSRVPLIHQKGAKESAKLVGPCSPIRGGEELWVSIHVFPFRMSHLLRSWQPWALEQLGKWKTKETVHDGCLYPQHRDLNTTSLRTPPLRTLNRCTHVPTPCQPRTMTMRQDKTPRDTSPMSYSRPLGKRDLGEGR